VTAWGHPRSRVSLIKDAFSSPGGCRTARLCVAGRARVAPTIVPFHGSSSREDASFRAFEAKADHADGPAQAIGVGREEPFCATENSAIVSLDHA